MKELLLFVCLLHVISIYQVCCMKLEVVPTNVVLSDSGNDNFTVRCSPTTQTSGIKSITSIRLYRYTQWDIDSGKTDLNEIAAIAYYNPNKPTFIGSPTDLTSAPRSANLTSRLNNVALADGDVDLEANFYIQLQLQRRHVECQDVGMYSCQVRYVDIVGVSHDDEGSQNLTVTARPSNISMEAKKNGAVVYESSSGPQSAPADFDVGDVVEIKCMAKTGSNKATLIKWRKVPEYTSDFQNWSPTTLTDDLDSETPVDCSYSRTVTMEYNVTQSDSQRADNMQLAFQCFISDGTFQTGNTPSFYIDAGSGNSGGGDGNEGASTAEDTAQAGVIAGAVIGSLVGIVIIVLLVYFLWYRRRSEGESYRTKEERGSENPNMAPNTADLYSVPHKERGRGRENKGLDEPHETKPHRNYRNADDYSNGTGHPNYGMDREDDEYSRDGSPTAMRETINHMGDPHGSIGTGV